MPRVAFADCFVLQGRRPVVIAHAHYSLKAVVSTNVKWAGQFDEISGRFRGEITLNLLQSCIIGEIN